MEGWTTMMDVQIESGDKVVGGKQPEVDLKVDLLV
jgi:hypothetical protein